MLAVVIAGFTLLLTAKLRYRGEPGQKLADESCDVEVWKHVYEKDRLRVLQACTAVNGRVVSVHRNSDGDLHIALDPENKSVLSLINLLHAGGHLVLEIVCEHPATHANAQAACGTFHSTVAVPNVGDRVRVTGAYVTDRENGWNEIHPVARIETLP